ncbi:MAG: hypothetical protein KGM43_00845 [Planctomycetota bacterium]|nr:hypothetical protein [Planctomycetota bacterium]
MPRIIHCPACGIELNLPESALGRRLKCPSCLTKFVPSFTTHGSRSVADDARPSTSSEIERIAGAGAGRSSRTSEHGPQRVRGGDHERHRDHERQRDHERHREHERHVSGRDANVDLPSLRDTFDLPMTDEPRHGRGPASPAEALFFDDQPRKPAHPSAADALFGDTAPTRKAAPASPVEALFQEDDEPVRRRVAAGDARQHSRRCPDCGGVVPAGMSLCQRCGLNLETGMRIDLVDELIPEPEPPRPSQPVGVMLLGGAGFMTAVIGTLVALLKFMSVTPAEVESNSYIKFAYLCLALVGGFGIHASVQFFRGKSTKMMILALTLGVMVSSAGLIALPLIRTSTPEVVQTNATAPDDAGEVIVPPEKLLDTRSLFAGFLLVGVYVGSVLYILSPQVRRYVARH